MLVQSPKLARGIDDKVDIDHKESLIDQVLLYSIVALSPIFKLTLDIDAELM